MHVQGHVGGQVGRVYLIARGQLKMANKRFSALNNEYELNLGFDSAMQVHMIRLIGIRLIVIRHSANSHSANSHSANTSSASVSTRPCRCT